MPMYEFRCLGPCGRKFDAFLRLEDYRKPVQCCDRDAQKLISKPAVFGDLPGYESPATGEWVEGRKARANDLAKSGCVPYEPGMKEANAKRRLREDAEDRKKLEVAVDQSFQELKTQGVIS